MSEISFLKIPCKNFPCEKKETAFYFRCGIAIFLTLLSGILTASAFPGSPFPFCAWFCMAPWMIGSRLVPPPLAGMSGLLYGALYAVPCTWDGIYHAVENLNIGEAHSTIFTTLFYVPHILPFAIFSYCLKKLEFEGFRGAAAASSVMVSLIYIFPTVFPVTPGLMLHSMPTAIQIADIGGVPLVNFYLVLINFLIAETIRNCRNPRRLVGSLVAILIPVFATTGYGTWKLHEFNPDARSGSPRKAKVLMIQPNIPPGAGEIALVWDRRGHSETALEKIRRTLEEHPDADIVLLPEIPIRISCDIAAIVFRKLSAIARKTGVYFIYHCIDCPNGGGCFNSAAFVSPGSSAPDIYHKRALTPFRERKPDGFFSVWLEKMIEIPDGPMYLPGAESKIFRINREKHDLRLVPLICYDVHFPKYIRESRIGDAIMVIANDQIFGRSRIGYIDYAMNIFRAVEFRRPLARAANTGPSAAIGADGIPVRGTPTQTFQPAVLAVELFMPPKGHTVYGMISDVVVYIFYLWALSVFFFKITGFHRQNFNLRRNER